MFLGLMGGFLHQADALKPNSSLHGRMSMFVSDSERERGSVPLNNHSQFPNLIP